jgi:hypothetical protein
VRRRLQKTNTPPLNGSWASFCRTRRARPSMPQRKSAGSAATQTRRRAFSASRVGPARGYARPRRGCCWPLVAIRCAARGRLVGENQDANGRRQRQAEIEFDETRGHRRAASVYGGVPGGQTALQAFGVELQADRNLGDAVPLGEFGRLRPQLLRNARTARAGAPPLGKRRGGFSQLRGGCR